MLVIGREGKLDRTRSRMGRNDDEARQWERDAHRLDRYVTWPATWNQHAPRLWYMNFKIRSHIAVPPATPVPMVLPGTHRVGLRCVTFGDASRHHGGHAD